MSSETVTAFLWLAVNVVGLSISLRAVWRGQKRLRSSGDPVARAVHVAEFSTGVLFTLAFLESTATAIVSIYVLPVSPPATEYATQRAATLRYMLFGEKLFYILACLIPEILDRYLTRYAGRMEG